MLSPFYAYIVSPKSCIYWLNLGKMVPSNIKWLKNGKIIAPYPND